MTDVTEKCIALLKDLYDKQYPDKLYRVKNDVVWNDAINSSNNIIRIIKKNSPNVDIKLSVDPLIARDLDLILTVPADETFTIEDCDMLDFIKAFSKANYLDIYSNSDNSTIVNIGFRNALNSKPNQ